MASDYKAQKEHNSHYLNVLDLFSGPGGMSQGIREARNHGLRFRVVVGNDYDQAVMSTYTKNHRDVKFVLGSITDEKTKRDILSAIRKSTGKQRVDLVVGGPPCKGFSLENKMTRNMENPMNHLVEHYVEMIRRTKPIGFIMENVPGLFAMDKGRVVNSLLKKFRDLGYHNVDAWLLNAAEYGVPQVRKRAFIVGSKSRIPIDKPKKTHGTPDEITINSSLLAQTSLIDSIGDLPRIRSGKITSESNMYVSEPINQFQKKMRVKSHKITNHIITRNAPHVVARIKTVPPGGNWSDVPAKLMKVGGRYKKLGLAHSMIYKRLRKSNPSITITNFRKAMIIHPVQHRLLSVREAARIQTFPDHFEFRGGISNMQQQVSDAVPVMLAKKVGDAMLLHLHKIMISVHTEQKQLRSNRY